MHFDESHTWSFSSIDESPSKISVTRSLGSVCSYHHAKANASSAKRLMRTFDKKVLPLLLRDVESDRHKLEYETIEKIATALKLSRRFSHP